MNEDLIQRLQGSQAKTLSKIDLGFLDEWIDAFIKALLNWILDMEKQSISEQKNIIYTNLVSQLKEWTEILKRYEWKERYYEIYNLFKAKIKRDIEEYFNNMLSGTTKILALREVYKFVIAYCNKQEVVRNRVMEVLNWEISEDDFFRL